MGMLDNLRKAEEQGREKAHTMIDRARAKGSDMERKLRQRMRLYPSGKNLGAPGSSTSAAPSEVSQAAPAGESSPDLYGEQSHQMEIANPDEQNQVRPIVSINGQDVPTVQSTAADMEREKDKAA